MEMGSVALETGVFVVEVVAIAAAAVWQVRRVWQVKGWFGVVSSGLRDMIQFCICVLQRA
ncbi:MAG: hypothetical protein ACPG7F_04775 [Aggregatilineales bacterium]